jgi:glycerol-3-phosphate dehydrogenase (NAD(P)+)
MNTSIGVLGAGSWGATLAALLADKGNSVSLWEFNPAQAETIARTRELSFFPHLHIPASIEITNDIRKTCENKNVLLFVVPSHTMRATAKKLAETGIDLSRTILISATKGIENTTLKRMSEILAEELPGTAQRIAVLSGPTHAEEVAQKIPTAATAAASDITIAKKCQELFLTSYFRIYTHTDVAGVETGAAVKNVLAIAAGICDGLKLGDNTKAALVTRGLREFVELGVCMGGQPSTFFGLTGLGDLIVTCFSRHSRNRALGEKIGSGISLSTAETQLIMIAEGVKTSKSAFDLAQRHKLDLPIMEQVYRVLYENKSPGEAVQELMMREPKPEARLEIKGLVI